MNEWMASIIAYYDYKISDSGGVNPCLVLVWKYFIPVKVIFHVDHGSVYRIWYFFPLWVKT